MIDFLGQPRAVAHVSARSLVRIAAAIYELLKMSNLDITVIQKMAPSEYPLLIPMAMDAISSSLVETDDLTRPEEIIYGTMGMLVGCTAKDVAEAPLNDIERLARRVFEQERETQLGKRLMAMLQQFEQRHMDNTESQKTSESPSDMTSRTKAKSKAITGKA